MYEKLKWLFVLTIILLTSGCFQVTEMLLGCSDPSTTTPVVLGTIVQTVTIRPPFPVNWQYYWRCDTEGRYWWIEYNYHPLYWSKPRFPIQRSTMIPRDTKSGIDRYVDHGVPTGSFLRAVLSNDLFEAIIKADSDNQLALAAICRYVYDYTPNTCHGSPEAVANWIKFHRATPVEANNAAGGDRERREHFYD